MPEDQGSRKKLEGSTLEAFERSFKRNEKALRKLAELYHLLLRSPNPDPPQHEGRNVAPQSTMIYVPSSWFVVDRPDPSRPSW